MIWTPPTENLRPTVTLPPDLQGEVKLDAKLGDNDGLGRFRVQARRSRPADAPSWSLDREAGRKVPAGRPDASVIRSWWKEGDDSEPATDVHWPANFENEYVKWEAPVLTAKQEGYTQFLRAEVGGRNVLWHTTTYRPGEYSVDRRRAAGRKARSGSRSLASKGRTSQTVRFPVGATFTDFKVEVHYPDGYTRFVTKKAMLTTPEPPAERALLTADHGKLVGLRPG